MTKEEIQSLIDIEALYQHAPCGYLSFLPDGTIIKINQTLLTWLKREGNELIFHKKFSDLLSKGGNMHYEMFFRPMINVYGTVKELSYELVDKDGQAFPVLLSATTMKDSDNRIMAINAALYEITDRKKFEKELVLAKKNAENEKKRFTFLANMIPEIIWTADGDGKIDYVNDRFHQYLDVDKKFPFPPRLLLKIHPEDRRSFTAGWKNAFQSGKKLDISVRLKKGDQSYYWHLVKGAPYNNEHGSPTKWFGSCYNIDEQVKALQKRDDFINIASHELKTPVTSLNASLQILSKLKSNPSSAMIPKFIEQAARSSDKITTLIADLLNASQITQGHLQLSKKHFPVGQIIDDCCHFVRLSGTHNITFQGDPSVLIYCDEGRIGQVITNLVNNALKYAPNAKIISIKTEKVHNSVRIAVIDQGPGIPKEKQSQLFDRYYRGDQISGITSGLGLGLYICAEIIRKHGGDIGVDSTLGSGSTFWFTLPSQMQSEMTQ